MFKRILIFLLVLTALPFAQAQQKQDLKLEDIVNNTFWNRSVYGLRSMADGLHYTVLSDGMRIEKYSYKTGEQVQVLFDAAKFGDKLKHISGYELSADESKILVYTGRENIYRHSFRASYFVYDMQNNSLVSIREEMVQLADFSPNADKLAYVFQNNLYVYEMASGTTTQITSDGEFNHIIYGAPDWVYEEEFSFAKGFQWSPDGKYLAYYRFDESHVKQFSMMMYEGASPAFTENTPYPQPYTFKYPKAGEANSVVQVWVYNLEKDNHISVDLGTETDIYIPRIKWTHIPNKLAVVRLNRHQNHYELFFADALSGKTQLIYEETNKAYVEINDDLTFFENGQQFVLTSEKDGYRHIYLYNSNGELVRQLTSGNWEVSEFLGVDEKKQLAYYQSTESSPMQRNVYVVSFNGKTKQKLSKLEGTNRAVFSKGFKYYVNYYSSHERPNLVTLHNTKGKEIRVLEDNSALHSKLKDYNLPSKEFFTFTTDEGVELNGWMLKPHDFDPNKQYAAMLYIYGGPGSQTVLDRWELGWYHYLSENGIIVYSIDNRGTGGRGEAFKKSTYLQLQNLEAIDMIASAKYVGELPFINKDKIAVYGWSFGGQMSSLCMFRGAEVFNTGIAVAPVTNYRYYDNIYSERYLRTPHENPKGYDDYAPITHAHKLKGNFLLIHGLADDNVHAQNSIEMAERLVQANKQFEMFYYTNRNHGIYGGNTRLHLFTKMTNFLLNKMEVE